MNEPTFDHERLDVYRLSIEYVAFSYRIARSLSGVHRPARDQWLRAAQSIPLNIAEGNGKQSLKDKNRFFEIARGSALECASIHDVLRVCDAVDDESSRHGKSELKRIVSMLTRLIQRKQSVAEDAFEYEYEYRKAEYEYEETPDTQIARTKDWREDRWPIHFCGASSLDGPALIQALYRRCHELRSQSLGD